MSRSIAVAGVTLEVEEAGQGRDLLFLHPGEGSQPARGWIEALARDHHVIAPHHPGFGNSSLPDWFGTADDIAKIFYQRSDLIGRHHIALEHDQAPWRGFAQERALRRRHFCP